MGKIKSFLCQFLIVTLAAGLSGCIILSASPDPDDTIYLKSGEKVRFKVTGLVAQLNPLFKYEWSIVRFGYESDHRKLIDYQQFIDYSGDFEFVADFQEDQIDVIEIYCNLIQFYPNDCGNPGDIIGECNNWESIDVRSWTIIRIQDPPSWSGSFYINNKQDLQILEGFSEVTGNLIIDGSDASEANTIEDLEALNSLASVSGNLTIKNNNALTSMGGLNNITSIGDKLTVLNNGSLSVLGLDSLCSIGEDDYDGSSIIIKDNIVLCTHLAEALKDKVLLCDLDGIPGEISISGNKVCPTP